MKLVRISIHNFRQFRDVEIEFSSGLIGITGNNGAGKTTLIEAITFALFGTKAIRGKVDDLKTKGVGKDKVLVELTFAISQVSYRIVRSPTDAKLFMAGEGDSGITGSREVTSQVAKLLGMNLEEFSATFLTEQKGLEFLSGKKGATEREKFIARMMGFDRLDTLQELLRSQRKDKKQLAAGYEAGLGDRAELTERLEREKIELAKIEASLVEKSRGLDECQKSYDLEKSVMDTYEKNFEVFRAISQVVSNDEGRFDESSRRLRLFENRLKEIDGLEILGRLFRVFRHEKSMVDAVAEAHAALAMSLKIVKENSALFDELRRDRELQLVRQQEKIKQLEMSAKSLASRINDTAALEKKAECPTCGQPLGTTVKKVLEELKKENAALRHYIEDEKSGLLHFQNPTEKERQVLEEKITLARLVTEQESLVKTLQQFAAVEQERITLEGQLATLREEIKLTDERLHHKRKELSSLGFSEPAYRAQKAKLAASDSMTQIARNQKIEIAGELKGKQALLARTTAQIKSFEEKQLNLQSLRESLLVYEESDTILTEFRKALNESIRPKIAELASEFLSELTDGRYAEVFIGADFAPTVFDGGEIKSVISGGETDILHLCVRLALSQLLAERAGQNFNLLVLDEVFGSLDQQRRQSVLILLEKLARRFDQILIITHMDDIREGVDAVLHISFDPAEGIAHVSEGIEEQEFYF